MQKIGCQKKAVFFRKCHKCSKKVFLASLSNSKGSQKSARQLFHVQSWELTVWDFSWFINFEVKLNHILVSRLGSHVTCPDHTKLSVQFQPRNCWGLCWGIDVGPTLFILLQLEMLTDAAISGWCDRPLSLNSNKLAFNFSSVYCPWRVSLSLSCVLRRLLKEHMWWVGLCNISSKTTWRALLGLTYGESRAPRVPQACLLCFGKVCQSYNRGVVLLSSFRERNPKIGS